MWYAFGHALAYGEGDCLLGWEGFLGNTFSKYVGLTHSYQKLAIRFGYAVTSTTITSGIMAERTHLWAYCVFSSFTTGLMFPVMARAAWYWKKKNQIK